MLKEIFINVIDIKEIVFDNWDKKQALNLFPFESKGH